MVMGSFNFAKEEGMELREFVAGSILQIIDGVKNAQDLNKTDARISPSALKLGNQVQQSNLYDFGDGMLLSNVEFDVAVTAEKSAGTKGGIGVFVGAVGLGSQGKSDSKDQSVSRIKFSVPISLPKGN
jgi:hypothetical protein